MGGFPFFRHWHTQLNPIGFKEKIFLWRSKTIPISDFKIIRLKLSWRPNLYHGPGRGWKRAVSKVCKLAYAIYQALLQQITRPSISYESQKRKRERGATYYPKMDSNLMGSYQSNPFPPPLPIFLCKQGLRVQSLIFWCWFFVPFGNISSPLNFFRFSTSLSWFKCSTGFLEVWLKTK